MKLKLIIILISLFNIINCRAQDVVIVNDKDVCTAVKDYSYVKAVDTFKTEVTITMDISSFSVARNTKKIDFSYSETIENETKIVQVTKKGAIRISIGRVVENGKKYYIFQVHLYKKDKECWREMSTFGNWTKCSLGTMTHGYAFGTKNTKNYIGFYGPIKIS